MPYIMDTTWGKCLSTLIVPVKKKKTTRKNKATAKPKP